MSSSSRPSGPTGPLSLPLCKLSFCTTPTLASKMAWTHIPAQDDMFAVVDQVKRLGLGGSITTRKMLKLIRGGNILEEIDLHDLMFQARLDEERAGSQSMQDSDPRVVFIIKRPLVALRYQLSDGQIRRLQLKLQSDSAYDAMVELFEGLGFQINDRTPAELPNCPQVSLQPQYAGLSTSITQDRHPSAPIIPAASISGPLPLPDLTARATTSCGAETRPSSSAPEIYSVRPFTAPLSLSQMLPPKRVLPFPSKNKTLTTPNSEMTPSSSLPDRPGFAENPVTVDRNNTFTATASSANVIPPNARTVNTADSQNSVPPSGITAFLPDEEMIDVPSTPEVPPTVTKFGSTTAVPEQIAAGPPAKAPPKPKKVNRPATSPQSRPVTKAAKPRRKPPTKPNKSVGPPTNPDAHPDPSKPTSQAPNVFEDVEPAEFMARLDGWVREYQHLPAPRPLEATSENLAAYTAQSTEERMKIIDDMICECLGDENFVKLVEDVGDSWRRIGLGL